MSSCSIDRPRQHLENEQLRSQQPPSGLAAGWLPRISEAARSQPRLYTTSSLCSTHDAFQTTRPERRTHPAETSEHSAFSIQPPELHEPRRWRPVSSAVRAWRVGSLGGRRAQASDTVPCPGFSAAARFIKGSAVSALCALLCMPSSRYRAVEDAAAAHCGTVRRTFRLTMLERAFGALHAEPAGGCRLQPRTGPAGCSSAKQDRRPGERPRAAGACPGLGTWPTCPPRCPVKTWRQPASTVHPGYSTTSTQIRSSLVRRAAAASPGRTTMRSLARSDRKISQEKPGAPRGRAGRCEWMGARQGYAARVNFPLVVQWAELSPTGQSSALLALLAGAAACVFPSQRPGHPTPSAWQGAGRGCGASFCEYDAGACQISAGQRRAAAMRIPASLGALVALLALGALPGFSFRLPTRCCCRDQAPSQQAARSGGQTRALRDPSHKTTAVLKVAAPTPADSQQLWHWPRTRSCSPRRRPAALLLPAPRLGPRPTAQRKQISAASHSGLIPRPALPQPSSHSRLRCVGSTSHSHLNSHTLSHRLLRPTALALAHLTPHHTTHSLLTF